MGRLSFVGRLFAAVLINGAGALSPTAWADGPILTVAALPDYAPYSDQTLPAVGFSNDIVAQAMEKTGHKVKIVIVPWARGLAGTIDGTYDILPSAWYSAERAKVLFYSDPYVINRLVFVKAKGSTFNYTKLEDLAGKSVGTVIGYSYNSEFLNSPIFKRDPAESVLINLRKVAAGRIDLTLDDELTLKYLIRTKVPELTSKLELTSGALSEQNLYVTFSKKRSDAVQLVADFNKGLAEMKSDGSYAVALKLFSLK
jgi:polar amino acid transport system substrate-binding protein